MPYATSPDPAVGLVQEPVVVLTEEFGRGLAEDARRGVGGLSVCEGLHPGRAFFERLDGFGEREPPRRALFAYGRYPVAPEQAESTLFRFDARRHQTTPLCIERGLQAIRNRAQFGRHDAERVVLGEREGRPFGVFLVLQGALHSLSSSGERSLKGDDGTPLCGTLGEIPNFTYERRSNFH